MDERDSTWERDDPRFRVYVFAGPGNAVSTVDVLDATIEQALESARTLSKGDECLWALALVDDHSRGSRGLIWLSGMDYHDIPTTSVDWQRRRQMQDRYLKDKRRRGLACKLPNGLRVIRVFPEWVTGWPLWESFSEDYRLTGPALGLTRGLSDALYAWNESWRERQEEAPIPEGWEERGRHLVQLLQTELEGVAEVRPEFMS